MVIVYDSGKTIGGEIRRFSHRVAFDDRGNGALPAIRNLRCKPIRPFHVDGFPLGRDSIFRPRYVCCLVFSVVLCDRENGDNKGGNICKCPANRNKRSIVPFLSPTYQQAFCRWSCYYPLGRSSYGIGIVDGTRGDSKCESLFLIYQSLPAIPSNFPLT